MTIAWANELVDAGRYAEALAAYEAVHADLTKQGLVREATMCEGERAIALSKMGRYADALATFEAIEPYLKSGGMHYQLAACYAGRAYALMHLARYPESLEACDNAQEVIEQHDLKGVWPSCENHRGHSLKMLGRLEEAEAAVGRAEKAYAAENDAAGVALCQINRVLLLLLLDRSSDVLQVLERIDASPLTDDELHGYYGLFGEALWKCGRSADALEAFLLSRQALGRARQMGAGDESNLEFVADSQRRIFLANSVKYAIEARQVEMAFEAVQDGKAGLFGDIRNRLAGGVFAEPAGLAESRRELTSWLRRGPSSRVAVGEWWAEACGLAEAYLRGWRISRHARRRSKQPRGDLPPQGDVLRGPVSTAEIQSSLPVDHRAPRFLGHR